MSQLKLIDHRYWEAERQNKQIVGCSLTGWQDMINSFKGFVNYEDDNYSINEILENFYPEIYEKLNEGNYLSQELTTEETLLLVLKIVAHDEIKKYVEELNNMPNNNTKYEVVDLITTVKPEGTLSILPTVSSGIHFPYSNYYIRRVRINKHDPLVKVAQDLNYPIHNEVGQEDEEKCNTKVIDFYCKSESSKVQSDVDTISQLENYKKFMKYYVDHNASVTITVKKDQWNVIPKWLYDNWDYIVGITFIEETVGYKLPPYEPINKEEYLKYASLSIFDPYLIKKYEVITDKDSNNDDVGNLEECKGGVCPVR